MTDRRIAILNWLTQLKHAVQTTSEPVTKDKLATYVALLHADFDGSAFNRESLAGCTSAFQFFPAYAVLKTHLQDYLDSKSERSKRISGSSGDNFLPKWLHEKIMQQCGNRPGPMLQGWLDGKVIER